MSEDMATDANPSALSLELKARRLAVKARVMDEDEDARRGESQLRTAISRLDDELTLLAASLELIRAVRGTGAVVHVDVDLVKPAKELADRVKEIGRPTPQYLQARVRAVASARTAIEFAAREGWQAWVQEQHAALPLELIPRVEFYNRDRANRIARTLPTTAKTTPDVGLVASTKHDVAWLRDVLAKVEDHDLDHIIKRLPLTLAEISEDDLLALRRDTELAERLAVRLV